MMMDVACAHWQYIEKRARSRKSTASSSSMLASLSSVALSCSKVTPMKVPWYYDNGIEIWSIFLYQKAKITSNQENGDDGNH